MQGFTYKLEMEYYGIRREYVNSDDGSSPEEGTQTGDIRWQNYISDTERWARQRLQMP